MQRTAAQVPNANLLDLHHPLRVFGYYLSVAYILTKIGIIHEVLGFKLGVDTHLPLVLGLPAILLALLGGALQRSLPIRITHFWLAFGVWLMLSIPTSYWMAGSINLIFKTYFRTAYPLFFLAAGLVLTYTEVRKFMYAIAIGGVLTTIWSRMFGNMSGGNRLEMEFGSIGNSGDLAAQMLLVVPFLLFVLITTKSILIRLLSLGFIGLALHLTLATGARAAILALIGGILFTILRGTGRLRMVLVSLFVTTGFLMVLLLPSATLKRLTTFDEPDMEDEATYEAVGSANARRALIRRAWEYTLRHPLFGVGPGEFTDYDANVTREKNPGRRAQWQVTHNSYLEISSEAGIPALAFLLAAMGSTLLALNRIFKQGAKVQSPYPITETAFFLMLAIVIHAISIFFLSMGYGYTMPILLGLSAGFVRVVQQMPREPAAANPGPVTNPSPMGRPLKSGPVWRPGSRLP